MKTSSKCTLTIDLGIIKNNYSNLQKTCKFSEVSAVVKADCYGLGLKYIAPVLANSGCKYFFVTNKDEGIYLRKRLAKEKNNYQDVIICVLNGYFSNDKYDLINYSLVPVLNSFVQVELWTNLAYELNRKLPCFLHIDTGINRLGIQEEEIYTLKIMKGMKELNILCIMSHLSSSDEVENQANKEQLRKFQQLASLFPYAKKSLVNSGGIFLGKEYHFDITRPGIAIYGCNLSSYTSYSENSVLQSSIKLSAPIIQVTSLKKGDYIGYNRTYQVQERCVIATLPLGYADGYPRSLSNKGIVFINNKPAPVVGAVSMDLTTVDVTKIPLNELFLGKDVEIIGENITIKKLAMLAQTNSHEILTLIGKRYHRIYKNYFPYP